MELPAIVRRIIETLYEDDDILAVVKPAGIDTGGAEGRTASGLIEILADVRERGETLEPSNRLARFESGVLLLGKNSSIVRHIRTGLSTARIEQEFMAVVHGRMRERNITIDSQGKSAPRAKTRSPKKTGLRGPEPRHKGGRTLLSLVRQGDKRALIRCRTTVRNTHALRAQLRSVGLRLLGDDLHNRSVRARRPEQTCLHLTKIAFHHPGAGRKLTVSSRFPESFQAAVDGDVDVERLLSAALARRLTCLMDDDTDAYRLLTGNREGIKGLTVERWGPAIVMSAGGDRGLGRGALRSMARWYREVLKVQTVCEARSSKNQPADGEIERIADESVKPLAGKPLPPELVISENGLRFLVKPCVGSSAGLFLDHRLNRRRLRSMAKDRDVLNLFAYTCGFSVSAAAGGARRIVSVDLSASHLEWGRRNFELNHLDTTKHEFITSETFDYLRLARKHGEQFDLIVLDPPTFAHGRKRSQDFSVARDLPRLVAESLALLRPKGVMIISTSYRRFTLRDIRDRVRQGADRRGFEVTDAPRLPPDFAADPDHAKTIFVRFH